MPFGKTLTPTRLPNGITNAGPNSPLFRIEHPSPLHQVVLGWGYGSDIDLPTGNTPTTTNVWTVTATTTTGTASLNPAAVWPPTHLLTTGTTANDQDVLQDKRIIKKNHYALRKVIVFGSFQITSTVANAAIAFGMFTGTSIAALGTDLFTFNKPTGGATLNFLNRNNSGTTLTTPVSTAVLINTLYGAVAYFDPFHNEVTLFFGVIDSLELQLSTQTPGSNIDLPRVARAVTATTNIPDGTNNILFGFGAQTTAAAAATVQFGPCGAVYVQ